MKDEAKRQELDLDDDDDETLNSSRLRLFNGETFSDQLKKEIEEAKLNWTSIPSEPRLSMAALQQKFNEVTNELVPDKFLPEEPLPLKPIKPEASYSMILEEFRYDGTPQQFLSSQSPVLIQDSQFKITLSTHDQTILKKLSETQPYPMTDPFPGCDTSLLETFDSLSWHPDRFPSKTGDTKFPQFQKIQFPPGVQGLNTLKQEINVSRKTKKSTFFNSYQNAVGNAEPIFEVGSLSQATQSTLSNFFGHPLTVPTHTVKAPPAWDNSAPNCSQCRKSFSLFFREHHCRKCGAVVCHNCSTNEIRLACYGSGNLDRTCDICVAAQDQEDFNLWLNMASNINTNNDQTCLKYLVFLSGLFPTEFGRLPIKQFANSFPVETHPFSRVFCLSKTAQKQDLLDDVLALHKSNKTPEDKLIPMLHFAYQNCPKPSLDFIRQIIGTNPSAFGWYTTTEFNPNAWQQEASFWISKLHFENSWKCLKQFSLLSAADEKSWISSNLKPDGIFQIFQYCVLNGKPLEFLCNLGDQIFKTQQNIFLLWARFIEGLPHEKKWQTLSECSLQYNPAFSLYLLSLRPDATVRSTIQFASSLLKKNHFPEAKRVLRFLDLQPHEWISCALQHFQAQPQDIFSSVLCLMMLDNIELIFDHCPIQLCWIYCNVIDPQKQKFGTDFWFEKGKKYLKEKDFMNSIQCFYLSNLITANGRGFINIAKVLTQMEYPNSAMSLLYSVLKKTQLNSRYLSALHVISAMTLNQLKTNKKILREALSTAENSEKLEESVQKWKSQLIEEIEAERIKKIDDKVKAFMEYFNSGNVPLILLLLAACLEDHQSSILKFTTQLFAKNGHRLSELDRESSFIMLFFRGITHILKEPPNYVEGIPDIVQSLLLIPSTEAFNCITEIFSNSRRRTALCRQINSTKNLRMNQALPLLFGDLSLPPCPAFADKLRSNVHIVALKKCERGIAKEYQGKPLETAFGYCDIAFACPDSGSMVNCLLLASYYFSVALEAEQDKPTVYGLKEVIFILLTQVVSMQDKMNPSMMIYSSRFSLAISWKTINVATKKLGTCFSEREAVISSLFLSNVCTWTPVFPLGIGLNPMFSIDLLYQNCIMRELLQKMLNHYRENPQFGSKLLAPHQVNYIIFDGYWHNWLDFEDSKIEIDIEKLEEMDKKEKDRLIEKMDCARRDKEENEKREICMGFLLHERSWNAQQVASNINWWGIPRTRDGWISPETSKAPWTSQRCPFRSLNGFSLNLSTGEIQYFVQDAPRGTNDGLFGHQDIAEVMSLGIENSFFSLDQPESSDPSSRERDFPHHPFQQMRYEPKHMVKSDYLQTMLHTDYILKFFTTGVEVNPNPPFLIRSAQEGLMQRLPDRLKRLMVPIQGHRGGKGQAHRFWIEAGEIPFKKETQSNEDTIRVYFGAVPMKIKKHLLRKDSNGKLVDDDDPYDDSIEAKFARDLTTHYDDIGAYFPEFSRLRELAKISAMYKLINSFRMGMEEQLNNVDTKKNQKYNEIDGILIKIRNDITFPIPIQSAIQECLNDTKRDFQRQNPGAPWWKYESEAKSKITETLKKQAKAAEDKCCSDIASQLGSSFNTSISSSEIRTYLNGSRYDLAWKLTNVTIQAEKNQFMKFFRGIESAGFRHSNFPQVNGNDCLWVPAAFRKESTEGAIRMVYGGVNLAANLRANQNLLNPPVTSSFRLSGASLGAQRGMGAANSDAQRIDNLANFNRAQAQSQQAYNIQQANIRYQSFQTSQTTLVDLFLVSTPLPWWLP